MRQEEKTQEPLRRVVTGAAVGSVVGIFVCWPWDMFVGVSRSSMDVILPLVPLTLSFTLIGALVGAISSILGNDAPT